MTTTIQVDDDNKDILESLMDNQNLSSKNDAVSYLYAQYKENRQSTNNAEQLQKQKEKLQDEVNRMPEVDQTSEEIYNVFDISSAEVIPDSVTEYLIHDCHHILTLFEKDSPYLESRQNVGQVNVLSILKIKPETYLFVYHPLHDITNSIATFLVYENQYEKELQRILENAAWALPPGGVEPMVDINGEAQPVFGGLGQPSSTVNQEKLYGLPEINQISQYTTEIQKEYQEYIGMFSEDDA